MASQTVLGSRDLLALRGLIADDPFRAVQVLPGVATGDDFRAEFAVRGLGPSNIAIAVDGVDSSGSARISARASISPPATARAIALPSESLDADRIDRTFSGTRSTTLLDKSVGASSQAIWAQYRWTPASRIVVTPGVRVEHWLAPSDNRNPGVEGGLIDQTEASPWLLSEWELRPNTRVKFGAGLQRQAPTIDHTFYTLPVAGILIEF
ncbi:MAG: hypothetical protein Q7R30_12295 [Acidobacteriota bacterium]|nr:hypothetical protein [Acidobacteriota bacterium]